MAEMKKVFTALKDVKTLGDFKEFLRMKTRKQPYEKILDGFINTVNCTLADDAPLVLSTENYATLAHTLEENVGSDPDLTRIRRNIHVLKYIVASAPEDQKAFLTEQGRSSILGAVGNTPENIARLDDAITEIIPKTISEPAPPQTPPNANEPFQESPDPASITQQFKAGSYSVPNNGNGHPAGTSFEDFLNQCRTAAQDPNDLDYIKRMYEERKAYLQVKQAERLAYFTANHILHGEEAGREPHGGDMEERLKNALHTIKTRIFETHSIPDDALQEWDEQLRRTCLEYFAVENHGKPGFNRPVYFNDLVRAAAEGLRLIGTGNAAEAHTSMLEMLTASARSVEDGMQRFNIMAAETGIDNRSAERKEHDTLLSHEIWQWEEAQRERGRKLEAAFAKLKAIWEKTNPGPGEQASAPSPAGTFLLSAAPATSENTEKPRLTSTAEFLAMFQMPPDTAAAPAAPHPVPDASTPQAVAPDVPPLEAASPAWNVRDAVARARAENAERKAAEAARRASLPAYQKPPATVEAAAAEMSAPLSAASIPEPPVAPPFVPAKPAAPQPVEVHVPNDPQLSALEARIAQLLKTGAPVPTVLQDELRALGADAGIATGLPIAELLDKLETRMTAPASPAEPKAHGEEAYAFSSEPLSTSTVSPQTPEPAAINGIAEEVYALPEHPLAAAAHNIPPRPVETSAKSNLEEAYAFADTPQSSPGEGKAFKPKDTAALREAAEATDIPDSFAAKENPEDAFPGMPVTPHPASAQEPILDETDEALRAAAYAAAKKEAVEPVPPAGEKPNLEEAYAFAEEPPPSEVKKQPPPRQGSSWSSSLGSGTGAPADNGQKKTGFSKSTTMIGAAVAAIGGAFIAVKSLFGGKPAVNGKPEQDDSWSAGKIATTLLGAALLGGGSYYGYKAYSR